MHAVNRINFASIRTRCLNELQRVRRSGVEPKRDIMKRTRWTTRRRRTEPTPTRHKDQTRKQRQKRKDRSDSERERERGREGEGEGSLRGRSTGATPQWTRRRGRWAAPPWASCRSARRPPWCPRRQRPRRSRPPPLPSLASWRRRRVRRPRAIEGAECEWLAPPTRAAQCRGRRESIGAGEPRQTWDAGLF